MGKKNTKHTKSHAAKVDALRRQLDEERAENERLRKKLGSCMFPFLSVHVFFVW